MEFYRSIRQTTASDRGREQPFDDLEARGTEETRGTSSGYEEDAGEAAERVAVTGGCFPRQAAVVARCQATGGDNAQRGASCFGISD